MKSVVVTGASTGIGGGLRKSADRERFTRIRQRAMPLIFDVTNEATLAAAAKQVKTALGAETLFGLVNNAGVLRRDL